MDKKVKVYIYGTHDNGNDEKISIGSDGTYRKEKDIHIVKFANQEFSKVRKKQSRIKEIWNRKI